MPPTLAKEKSDFPTILVAHEVSATLVDALRAADYLVLEARDREEAISIARMHSRPIHLLLIDPSPDSRSLADLVRPYRPKISVLVVGDGIDLPSALAAMRQKFSGDIG